MTAYADGIAFQTITCCNCSMPFGMSEAFYQKRLRDHEDFHCPAGHKQHFTGATPEEKLQRQLARQQEIADANMARASRAETERDNITRAHKKMRARVMNGVCPCCTRSFQNLMRHMQAEHPEFADKQDLASLRVLFGMTQTDLANEADVKPSHVSNYERGKHVATFAQGRLDRWVAAHKEKA